MILYRPSSNNKTAIFLYKNNLFFENNFSYIPFLNHQEVYVKVPSFDYLLSDSVASMNAEILDTSNFIFGAVKSLKINGIDYYSPVDTFTYSDFISTPMNNVLKTSGSFLSPGLLPFVEGNQISMFQEVLWRLAVYPFLPFFLYTDMAPSNIGGPLFIKTFNISVEDKSGVDIQVDFEGGVSVKSPDPGSIDSEEFPFTDTYYSEIATSPLDRINESFSHRVTKIYDCLFGIPIDLSVTTSVGIYTSYYNQRYWYSNQNNVNITSMKLSINQELKLTWTSNDGIYKNIIDGIRCVSMRKRTVSGNIKFIASTDLTFVFSKPKQRIQELVMYFGGPFYFPMKNVNINIFSASLNAETGYYEHELSFFAMLQPPPERNYTPLYSPNDMDWYKLNIFNISYEGIFRDFEGNIYVEPQSNNYF